MTSSQSFKMYEIFQRYFNNDADAKVIVDEIGQTIDVKFEDKKETLATKQDIAELRLIIQQLREELKVEMLSIRVEMEKRFNNILMWMIGTMIALVGIVVGILKLSS